MRIEHAGIQVEDPAAMGQWYVEHLGFTCKRAADAPAVPVRFIADDGGRIMLEVYRNPKAAPPDYRKLDPLLFHIAFVCEDVPATMQRLIAAGATIYAEERPPSGDHLVMMRDPWGLPIQLCKRAKPMV
jgi:glyoxylase I family protein